MSGKLTKNQPRVFKISGSPVPLVLRKNQRRNLTYKIPANLLQPKELLKAKLKNKANTLKQQANLQRIEEERRRAQARFNAILNATRRNIASRRRGPGARGHTSAAAAAGNSEPSNNSNAFVNLTETFRTRNTVFRKPTGSRSNVFVRKANRLVLEQMAKKAAEKAWGNLANED